MQRALEGELRLSVRVGRRGRSGFLDRLPGRLAVDCRRRREHQPADAPPSHGFQQEKAGDDVVAVVLRRFSHRLANERIRRHVDDSLDTVERRPQRGRVQEIGLDELRLRVHGVAVTLVKAVVHDRRVAGRQQLLDDAASDVPGAAGDQNTHHC